MRFDRRMLNLKVSLIIINSSSSLRIRANKFARVSNHANARDRSVYFLEMAIFAYPVSEFS